MTKRMLIDAAHPEETRVVVLDGNRLEDFDYESASRKTLKGNIYLGKITRVEPSLQAAFVEYGGNRHGFLPFNDIHPDYYRIPIADREALIAQEAEFASSDEAEGEAPNGRGDGAASPNGADPDGAEDEDSVETVGGEEFVEPPRNLQRLRRTYKIQEVIKRRQVVLVQVTKEERGNKGAALTTYISLAGRYCVLMPNAIRGGGISRKITNVKDRRRLKEVIESLDVPDGMGVILRTAGMERSKAEIRRDYDFLLRVWDDIREKTFSSRAPALIYEEANLIKRTIRDVYSRDIEEILVEGEEAYRTAKNFMRALMPSHAKRVRLYKNPAAHLFPEFQVESQLDALHSSTVRLKSGGYIVINPTEALVAVDVNSGRATRERHIEETALRTNLEAASEIARQLRLRDLAGLVVIDFIDMEDRRNNAAVERRLKEAMRLDRARVQIGRISSLGLLELSRQRLRPSLLETSMQTCPTCDGRGLVRTVESTALHVFRALEEEAARRRSAEVAVYVPAAVALYLLNQKRNGLVELEQEQGMRVLVERDDSLVSPAYRIEHLRAAPPKRPEVPEPAIEEEEAEAVLPPPASVTRGEARAEAAEAAEAVAEQSAASDEAERARRRRRGRRGGRRRGRRPEDAALPAAEAAMPKAAPAALPAEAGYDGWPAVEEARAAAGEPGPEAGEAAAEPAEPAVEAMPQSEHAAEATDGAGEAQPKEPRPRRRRPRHRPRPEPAGAAEVAPTVLAEAGPALPAEAEPEASPPGAEEPAPAEADQELRYLPVAYEPALSAWPLTEATREPVSAEPAAAPPAAAPAEGEAPVEGEAPQAEAPELLLQSPSAWEPQRDEPAAAAALPEAAETGAPAEAAEERQGANHRDADGGEAQAEFPPLPAVAAEAGETEQAPAEPPRPRRRGWWQRLTE